MNISFVFIMGVISIFPALCWSEVQKTNEISSFQERCYKGEISVCKALSIRARQREERCNTCSVPTDKAICLDEKKCWEELAYLHQAMAEDCKTRPHIPVCHDPLTEEVKKKFALCQMQGLSCQ